MEVKKLYSKPVATIVDFSLTSSIASTCVHYGNFSNGDECTSVDNETVLFSGNNGSCEWPVDDEYCYHAPLEDNSIFAS